MSVRSASVSNLLYEIAVQTEAKMRVLGPDFDSGARQPYPLDLERHCWSLLISPWEWACLRLEEAGVLKPWEDSPEWYQRIVPARDVQKLDLTRFETPHNYAALLHTLGAIFWQESDFRWDEICVVPEHCRTLSFERLIVPNDDAFAVTGDGSIRVTERFHEKIRPGVIGGIPVSMLTE